VTFVSEPSRNLIDGLFRDKVRQARQMSPEERSRAPGDLFDEVCDRMRGGIRWQFPDADPARVEEILRERLDIARRLERLP
jgi:hypothetical protein